jgi:hypothetical protein
MSVTNAFNPSLNPSNVDDGGGRRHGEPDLALLFFVSELRSVNLHVTYQYTIGGDDRIRTRTCDGL